MEIDQLSLESLSPNVALSFSNQRAYNGFLSPRHTSAATSWCFLTDSCCSSPTVNISAWRSWSAACLSPAVNRLTRAHFCCASNHCATNLARVADRKGR